eukprot:TRINITY_DN1258_c0_g2_i4.p1 TRINITY_DN1258_c0_g2~~TRINITY_DN1258_c0_g2_i4.p1  ORF type:complete len:177 (-),score=24.21 TRINITY_DN1258_c0_g2_i4:260-790(-)
MDTMLMHVKAVCRGAKRPFVIGDKPFVSYQPSNQVAIQKRAGAFHRAGADAVKLEGHFPERIRAVNESGVIRGPSDQRGWARQGLVEGYRLTLQHFAVVVNEEGCFCEAKCTMPASMNPTSYSVRFRCDIVKEAEACVMTRVSLTLTCSLWRRCRHLSGSQQTALISLRCCACSMD